MASTQVTVRLSPEVYKALVQLAELDRKNLAELTRELIEDGLGKHSLPQEDLAAQLQFMEVNLSELIARAVKASGQAAYYAKLASETTDETAQYVTTAIAGGQVLDAKSKAERAESRWKRARRVGEEYLNKPFAEI